MLQSFSASARDPSTNQAPEPLDVLIVGAGISGIAAAHFLKKEHPAKTFAMVDALESHGGTWLIHRYPGTRSDSDLFTFGFGFKPWKGNPIATRAQILEYLDEVIEEDGLGPAIRYRHQVKSATWSSEAQLWTVEMLQLETGKCVRMYTRFLWMCQGYYQHAKGYTPAWTGLASYQGAVIHPQQWPENLDLTGKRVVVIGSGATAATLVPAIAGKCSHVTMLQRTPTYFSTGRNADVLADELRRLSVDDNWIHEIIRRKVVIDRDDAIDRAMNQPEAYKKQLLDGVRSYLGPDFDVDKHFTPPYRPMQQRVAFIPDGDLFKAIRDGHASVVTDEIECFDTRGIALKSGERIDVDVVITATGFNMAVFSGIDIRIDGQPLNLPERVTYRGMMFTDVPNLLWTYGYNRYSWTLRADLISQFVCRLLGHMDKIGATSVAPTLRDEDRDMPLGPWVDPTKWGPGYLLRSQHLLPKRGDKPEWQHSQDFVYESQALPRVDLDDPLFKYATSYRGTKQAPTPERLPIRHRAHELET